MTEPIIACPKCKTEIRLTESLAAPLLESTRREFEKQLAQKDADIATRETSLREHDCTPLGLINGTLTFRTELLVVVRDLVRVWWPVPDLSFSTGLSASAVVLQQRTSVGSTLRELGEAVVGEAAAVRDAGLSRRIGVSLVTAPAERPLQRARSPFGRISPA